MADVKRILIVDDETAFLEMLQNALELRGMEVITATNAVEAGIEISTKKPDLILMDIKMPGINGLDACEAIKRNPATKNIPLAIISAHSEDVFVKKAQKAGVVDYFVKPINIESLVKRLKEILAI
ncbi:MAG: response regulator [Candidatus Omnitrophota bacterium]|jgi:DNA-binding response OmpR family regulator